MFDFKEQNE